MAELPKAAQGTFDELLAGVEPGLAAIARRLRAVIRAVDVSTVETVRLGDNAATYGVGPKKMTDGYAYIMPKRGYINLGFYQGAVLADPNGCSKAPAKGCVTSRSAPWPRPTAALFGRWWQRHWPADAVVSPKRQANDTNMARGLGRPETRGGLLVL